MPDTEPSEIVTSGLHSLANADIVVHDAIRHGLAAAEPSEVGDYGLARVVPHGYELRTIDVRDFEDEPRLRSYVEGTFGFVDVPSIAAYLERYKSGDSLAYAKDVFGKGLLMLATDTDFVSVVIDDHPTGAVARRAHAAKLVLRPTAAAKRWAAVLKAETLTQEQFLDLIVDGLTEIGRPDGAVLRDLVQDLHAIRQTEIKSVIRTGGEGAIQLVENVKLHAGPGDTVTFPEEMTVALTPFVGVEEQVVLNIRIKPIVVGDHVRFGLSCALIDEAVDAVARSVAASFHDATEIRPHWVP